MDVSLKYYSSQYSSQSFSITKLKRQMLNDFIDRNGRQSEHKQVHSAREVFQAQNNMMSMIYLSKIDSRSKKIRLKAVFTFIATFIIVSFNNISRQMKQVSLFDSFLKKQKPMDAPQPSTTQRPSDKDKKQEFGTSDKIENVHKPNKSSAEIPPFKAESFEDEENKQKSSFNELINSNDFAFDAQHDVRKKRKMEIEDDFSPYAPRNNREESMEEQLHESSSQDKLKKKAGKPQSVAKPKKIEQEAKTKRATITASSLANVDAPEQFTDVTPDWATPEGCRDSKGRKPNHPQYDPTTLYIPPEAVKGLTETMKQYWRIKSEHFDKIILFKLGKFYELFYEDAAVGNKHLDLKWMGSKMHVGFPEKCLDKYAHEFVQLGYRLVIVEQLETPDQMKERMTKERSEGKKTEKTLQRGVTQVLTKGTIVSFEDENQYLPNYLIAVSKHNDLIAYSLLEVGVNMIMVGCSRNIEEFKTMLFQTRPVELLYDPDNLPLELIDIMKQNWLQMILTRLPNKDNVWHPLNAKNQIETLVNSGVFNYPAVFESLEKVGGEVEKLILATLSGMFKYLKSCLKFEYIMSAVKFGLYEREGSAMSMVLDSQALQHLQIFETPLGQKDSLFSKIDRTHTKFGKRLLRRWIMQPLLDPMRINQRLDAVEDLQSISIDRNRVFEIFSKLPDLEKIVNRLYHYSVKTIAEKAVYFEDVSSARLREFRELIQHFNKCWVAVELLRKHKSKFTSQRLIRLITLQRKDNKNEENDEKEDEESGQLPSVRENLAQFDEYIKWQGDVPRPQKGLVESYDILQDELSQLKDKMQDYLDTVRRATGISSLKYVHTKERYQIQIPEQFEKKRLPEMIFTSKKSGFSRYVTEKSRKYVTDIENVEQQIKEQMGLFVGYFFQEFRKNQKIWEKFIAVIGEIDCLISMSLYSFQIGGVRPQFVEQGFDIVEAKHPCLNAGDIIANDINLDSKVMLLTGPNMGGKSTLLRTTCLLVILAQMGSYVPAERYSCEVIDRIFTRIGASDKLDEGKSTFFIEMEETKSILTYGTNRSLAIIDQLGRGTSTFDGMAIAYSVLLDIIERLHCRCIFATHYHSLSKQFQNISNVRLKMMDYLLADDRIVFLYKLKDGRAQQSFGLNVAKVVRIPQQIINRAEKRAKLMEEEIAQKDKVKKLKEAITLSNC